MNVSQEPQEIALRAHLLGPLRLTLAERAIEESSWTRKSSRSLLLLLLATPGHAIPRDRVLDLVWPDASPSSGMNALYVAIHGLRRVLEPNLERGRQSTFVEIENDLVRLRKDAGVWVDVIAFEQMLEAAGRQSLPEQLTTLREALALYAGDLLANEPYAEWAIPQREQLRTRWRKAVLETADLEQKAGSPLAAAQLALQVLADDPADEEAHRALMRALAGTGRINDALRQFDRCVEVLREELDAAPTSETIQLAAEIRTMSTDGTTVPATQEVVRRFHVAPAPVNRLIGRGREVEHIEGLLLDPDIRVVTISGPAGIGKTRLAVEVANLAAREFTNGVVFVPLASLIDHELVIPNIVRIAEPEVVPGTEPLAKLVELFQQHEVLLVLDNFEQVLDAAPQLAELVSQCAGLKLLVTSREPLHLRSEHVVVVPPLPIPPMGPLDADPGQRLAALARYESVELFVERVRAVQPGFRFTGEVAGPVVNLLHRTDGLPLAIELAAAASRDRLLESIAGEHGGLSVADAESYRDLPDRQRTMHQAIAWSYERLDPLDQGLFRRLSVFVGGCELEAAAALARLTSVPPGEVAHRLMSLIDKSLLYREETDTGPRYCMLETVREFGLGALRKRGEESGARSCHASHFLEVAGRAAPELMGPKQVFWFDQLETDLDNYRAALNWWRETGNAESVLRLGVALIRFWLSRGYYEEGRSFLQAALADKNVTLPVRAEALSSAGLLAEYQGDSAPAEALHRQALALWRRLGDRQKTAVACASLANVAQDSGHLQRAVELNEEALALYQEEQDAWGITQVSNNLGTVAYFQGEYQRAEQFWTDALAAIRRIGDVRSEGHITNNLAALAFQLGDLPRAKALHEQGLALRRRVGDKQGVASSLVNMSEISRAENDLPQAEMLAQQAAAIFGEIGDKRLGALAHAHLALIAKDRGDLEHAFTLALESVQSFHTSRDQFSVSGSLVIMGAVLVDLDQTASGVRLFAAADVIRESIGGAWEPGETEILEAGLARARSTLSSEQVSVEQAAGKSMTVEDAIAEILASAPA